MLFRGSGHCSGLKPILTIWYETMSHTFLKWPNTPFLSRFALFQSLSHNLISVKKKKSIHGNEFPYAI